MPRRTSSSTEAKCGSSLAPTATTTAITLSCLANVVSCSVWDGSVYWVAVPGPTCAVFAPEQARFTVRTTPGTCVSSISAAGERWHQSPFAPSVVVV